MQIIPFILPFLAGQAFFVFAISVKPFVVQNPITPVSGTGFCNNGDLPPQAHLDNGTFIGICEFGTARFLGIPYAQPP